MPAPCELRRRVLCDLPPHPESQYILYWLTATRRLERNHALDQALDWCTKLNKPLVILESLRSDYRWSCPRHHRVLLDAMAEHIAAIDPCKIRYYPYVEHEAGAGKGLLAAMAQDAAVVVTDRHPGFHFPAMLEAARKQLKVRFEVVESVGLLPLDVAPGPLPSAYVLRRRMQKNLANWLGRTAADDPLTAYTWGRAKIRPQIEARWPEATTEELAPAMRLESKIPLAYEVPVTNWCGGTRPARALLDRFIEEQLPRYGERRMEATPTSGLSMALHYGFLCPSTILDATLASSDTSRAHILPELAKRANLSRGSRAGWWGLSEQVETFLDQLVTWRELGHRFADQNPDCERYGSQPSWAVATLDSHRADAREFAYTREQFEQARTHDPLWNAAQRCLVREGWMPNYLRMLWGKNLLTWSQDPEEAWELLFHLNNLYALDGRDPNSMRGITWVFGRFDRPFGPERPVTGKLRPMSSVNTKRKMALGEFLDRFNKVERLFS
ncbi:MAG: deoxyribodipyrimidine photolyase [Planctomycetes bacterium]|nr:deoxyribodipyrimidine photolyase [Planctomycetota bacterium]